MSSKKPSRALSEPSSVTPVIVNTAPSIDSLDSQSNNNPDFISASSSEFPSLAELDNADGKQHRRSITNLHSTSTITSSPSRREVTGKGVLRRPPSASSLLSHSTSSNIHKLQRGSTGMLPQNEGSSSSPYNTYSPVSPHHQPHLQAGPLSASPGSSVHSLSSGYSNPRAVPKRRHSGSVTGGGRRSLSRSYYSNESGVQAESRAVVGGVDKDGDWVETGEAEDDDGVLFGSPRRAHAQEGEGLVDEEGRRRHHHSHHHGRAKKQRSTSRLGKLLGAGDRSRYGVIDAGRPIGDSAAGLDDGLDERAPLLGTVASASGGERDRSWRRWIPWRNRSRRSSVAKPYEESEGWKDAFGGSEGLAWLAIQALPAVVLGLILNLLDALSYGIIIFPSPSTVPGEEPRTSIPLHSATQSGISMFLASTIISQIVFALGGSAFKGANGSMMIEVMPFLHIMVKQIESRMIPSDPSIPFDPRPVLATVMTAYAMSTVITGLVFLGLGLFKLGNLIQFFPRHILVGCIGGIGWFLFVTGIEVTTGGVKPEFSLGFIETLFEPGHLALWGSALGLAMLLKLLQTRIHHPLFVPLFYVGVPVVFYVIAVGILRVPIEELRKAGFLFKMPEGDPTPFYTFWGYFNGLKGIRWDAIAATIGTQLALVFFAVLHVPINVPALAVSTHQAVDVNWEIVGHGISNLAAGLIGTPQNYLVYSKHCSFAERITSSLLYIRSGGNSTIGGLMLAVATAMIWMFGGSVIGFVPTLVVGSLIFHLAFDLMKESLWDTRLVGISHWEYATILGIVVTMAVFGFTEGILTGMVLACFFFVIMYSRKSILRSSHTGAEIRSTVHRPYRQKLYLDQVGDQIRIVKLQGFMFFGVISQLESFLERMLEDVPRIRFIVLEFGLITGVDYSAMEAFLRIKRLLMERNVHLVFCELGVVGRDLAMSGIFDHSHDDHQSHLSLSPAPAGDEVPEAHHHLSPHQQHHHNQGYVADDYQEVMDTRAVLEGVNVPASVATSVAVHPLHDQDRRDAMMEAVATTARVHNFETLDQALEFCENCLLVTFYRVRACVEGGSLASTPESAGIVTSPDKKATVARGDVDLEKGDGAGCEEQKGRTSDTRTSPRMAHARNSALQILKDDPNLRPAAGLGFRIVSGPEGVSAVGTSADREAREEGEGFVASTHPVPALLRSFGDATTWMTQGDLEMVAKRFERVEVRAGAVLWTPGMDADVIYLVESGELAQLMQNQGRMEVVETLLPGTMVGELELISGRARTCRLVVEEAAVVWKLGKESFDALCAENPKLSISFLRVALGFDCLRFSSCLSHQR
ncbi:hypothetical protein HDU97_005465 [Phlyctochytrium planicorne]|nr:hypothetical protein HDU97_005465 [Phlyctochytrium planicorne]